MPAPGMKPEDFRGWRKGLNWKQKDAADKLGLKKRVIQYYEKGDRDGKKVEIPKSVELACLALALGFETYDGHPVQRSPDAPAPQTEAVEPSIDEAVPAESGEVAAPAMDVAPVAEGEPAPVKPRRQRKKS